MAKEVGSTAAVAELGIPKSTLATWMRKAKTGEIDSGSGTRLPEDSLNLAQQLQAASKRIKELEWARMKEELFYSRNDSSENYTIEELKTMVWRYYMSYWANRRICTANGGLPPKTVRTKCVKWD